MKTAKRLVISILLVTIIAVMLPVPAAASGTVAWGAANINGSGVRIRSGPGLDHSILAHANRGDIVVIIERTSSEWNKVNLHGTIGYISVPLLENRREAANFSKRGSVSSSVVRMRERPNTTSATLGTHSQGTEMSIIGINNGWYKVTHNNTTGYIRSDLMTVLSRNAPASATAATSNAGATTTRVTPTGAAPDPNLPVGQSIANVAASFVGHRYVWGGTSPSGFDCSGLVTYVMRQHGISVSRRASHQYANNGTHINKSDLVVGDLVFFSSNGRTVTHVGIYVGGNNFVHASNPRRGVITSSLGSAYYTRTWFGAKRVA